MLTRTRHGQSSGFHRQGLSNAPRLITPAQRRRIQELVERLIGILDEADGDPDAEPSLGWSKTFAQGALDTDALLHDLEEDEAEREPWRVPARLDASHSSDGAAPSSQPFSMR